jgi:predicted TIM-barrel fold metal-dependent hydrolase
VSILHEPKVDCHYHVLDPHRFAYAPDVSYRPTGQEIGTLAQYEEVMACYNVKRAVIVGPNSGYNTDNRCLLDVLEQGKGRFKGIAVVPLGITRTELQAMRDLGVIGIAFNATLYGPEHYAHTHALLEHLNALDMWLQIQVENEQILPLLALIQSSKVKLLIDHCGRPSVQSGLTSRGFQALLNLGREQRAVVKLSGFQKFSLKPSNYGDVEPFVEALLEAFTPDACVWASDWPFLKATERLDYGPLLKVFERFVSSPENRRKILWDTPNRVFGFS